MVLGVVGCARLKEASALRGEARRKRQKEHKKGEIVFSDILRVVFCETSLNSKDCHYYYIFAVFSLFFVSSYLVWSVH